MFKLLSKKFIVHSAILLSYCTQKFNSANDDSVDLLTPLKVILTCPTILLLYIFNNIWGPVRLRAFISCTQVWVSPQVCVHLVQQRRGLHLQGYDATNWKRLVAVILREQNWILGAFLYIDARHGSVIAAAAAGCTLQFNQRHTFSSSSMESSHNWQLLVQSMLSRSAQTETRVPSVPTERKNSESEADSTRPKPETVTRPRLKSSS